MPLMLPLRVCDNNSFMYTSKLSQGICIICTGRMKLHVYIFYNRKIQWLRYNCPAVVMIAINTNYHYYHSIQTTFSKAIMLFSFDIAAHSGWFCARRCISIGVGRCVPRVTLAL